jgi:preprotein translocase subunit SecA
VQILDERVDNANKESFVKKATDRNMITLATCAFGRGIDFICKDRTVEANGGVHILQTFLSEEDSEEI